MRFQALPTDCAKFSLPGEAVREGEGSGENGRYCIGFRAWSRSESISSVVVARDAVSKREGTPAEEIRTRRNGKRRENIIVSMVEQRTYVQSNNSGSNLEVATAQRLLVFTFSNATSAAVTGCIGLYIVSLLQSDGGMYVCCVRWKLLVIIRRRRERINNAEFTEVD